MTAIALIAIAAGMALVRLGWGGRRAVALAGWLLAGAGLTVLTVTDGAWGCAIGATAAMVAASIAVLYAGWIAPVGPKRESRGLPAVAVPEGWRGGLRALAVFVLAAPVAFVAAQWFAFGVQAAARRAGAGEADAIVLAFFVQPICWTIVVVAQMLRARPAGMIVAPLIAAVLGTALWSIA